MAGASLTCARSQKKASKAGLRRRDASPEVQQVAPLARRGRGGARRSTRRALSLDFQKAVAVARFVGEHGAARRLWRAKRRLDGREMEVGKNGKDACPDSFSPRSSSLRAACSSSTSERANSTIQPASAVSWPPARNHFGRRARRERETEALLARSAMFLLLPPYRCLPGRPCPRCGIRDSRARRQKSPAYLLEAEESEEPRRRATEKKKRKRAQ